VQQLVGSAIAAVTCRDPLTHRIQCMQRLATDVSILWCNDSCGKIDVPHRHA
jgi:hypothetical protein